MNPDWSIPREKKDPPLVATIIFIAGHGVVRRALVFIVDEKDVRKPDGDRDARKYVPGLELRVANRAEHTPRTKTVAEFR